MNKESIEKAISEMPEYVPVRIIERNLGMPKTTLQKVLKGGRELPKKWIKPLEAYFWRKAEKKEVVPPETKKPKETPSDTPKINFDGYHLKLHKIKMACPAELKGIERTEWINTERKKQGI